MIYSDFFSNQYGYKNVWGFSYHTGYVIITNKKVIIRLFVDDSLNAYTIEYTLPEEIEPFSIVVSEYSETEIIITIFDTKSKSFKFLYFENGLEGGFNYYSYEYDESLFPDNPTIFNYLTSQYEVFDPSKFINELYAIPLSNAVLDYNKLTTKMLLNANYGETSKNVTYISTNTSSTEDYVDIKSMLLSTDPDRHIRINCVDYLGLIRFPYPNMMCPYHQPIGPRNVYGNLNFTSKADIVYTPKSGAQSLDESIDYDVSAFTTEFLYNDPYATKAYPYDSYNNFTDSILNSGSFWTEEYFSSNLFKIDLFNNYLNAININFDNYNTQAYMYGFMNNLNISNIYYLNEYNSDFLSDLINGFFLYSSVGWPINSSSDNEAYYQTLSYTQHIPYLWYDGVIRILSTIVSKCGLCIMISNVYTDMPNYYTFNIKLIPTIGYTIIRDYGFEIPALIPLFVNDKYMYIATVVTHNINGNYYIDESILKIPLFKEMAISEFKYTEWRPFDIFTTSNMIIKTDNGYGTSTYPFDYTAYATSCDAKPDDYEMNTLSIFYGKTLFNVYSSYDNMKPLTTTSRPALIFKELNKDFVSNSITYTVSFNMETIQKLATNSDMDVIQL